MRKPSMAFFQGGYQAFVLVPAYKKSDADRVASESVYDRDIKVLRGDTHKVLNDVSVSMHRYAERADGRRRARTKQSA